MTDASTDIPQRTGGGPLRAIADDASRSEAERELAESLIGWMRQRQAEHGKRIPVPGMQDLSIAQVKLLFYMPAEGTLSTTRFAEAAGMTPASLSQALEPLERAGAVERTRSERDRRVVEVGITASGHELLAALREAFTKRWDRHVAPIPPEELEIAARVLGRVLALFDPNTD